VLALDGEAHRPLHPLPLVELLYYIVSLYYKLRPAERQTQPPAMNFAPYQSSPPESTRALSAEPLCSHKSQQRRSLGCCTCAALAFAITVCRRGRRHRHGRLQRPRTRRPTSERLLRQPRRRLHVHRQQFVVRNVAGHLDPARSVSRIPRAPTCGRSRAAVVRAQVGLRALPRVAEFVGVWRAVFVAYHLQLDEHCELDVICL
jgi:hypothetical protein